MPPEKRSLEEQQATDAPPGQFPAAELARLTELPDQEAWQERLDTIRNKKGFLCDMDGVIYHGNILLPGAKEFVAWMVRQDKKFLFLTNNSAPTPQELSEKLKRLGLDIGPSHFYTSAQSTAAFLKSQKPRGGSCYVIGEPGLTYALYEHGFTMSSESPDYVVIGEGSSQNYEKLTRALNLVVTKGAKLIGTNPDTNGVTDNGMVLGTGAFLAALESASGKKAFSCGKPSSLMMQYAQSLLGVAREDTCIIGDRMDTDILAGINTQIDPVLVMSGVTNLDNLFIDAYRPFLVLNGVGEIVSN
ncbi:HAD-superfamily hydrolase, subfamily IIA [Chytriomyces sp. MP71]|nr:HAD-superfamily hydrolase, subfamily IIA [Chytriomyces sp. MP71]